MQKLQAREKTYLLGILMALLQDIQDDGSSSWSLFGDGGSGELHQLEVEPDQARCVHEQDVPNLNKILSEWDDEEVPLGIEVSPTHATVCLLHSCQELQNVN